MDTSSADERAKAEAGLRQPFVLPAEETPVCSHGQGQTAGFGLPHKKGYISIGGCKQARLPHNTFSKEASNAACHDN